jgi:hypothetical protein
MQVHPRQLDMRSDLYYLIPPAASSQVKRLPSQLPLVTRFSILQGTAKSSSRGQRSSVATQFIMTLSSQSSLSSPWLTPPSLLGSAKMSTNNQLLRHQVVMLHTKSEAEQIKGR